MSFGTILGTILVLALAALAVVVFVSIGNLDGFSAGALLDAGNGISGSAPTP